MRPPEPGVVEIVGEEEGMGGGEGHGEAFGGEK